MRFSIAFLVLAAWCQGRPEIPEIAAKDFQRLHEALRPQRGESPWRDIEWMTSIRGAREKAAAEGKPILVFTAADGSPLART